MKSSNLNEAGQVGTVSKTHIRGLDNIAEIDAAGNIQFLHTDVLGSTILITNSTGNVVQKYEYDAFGLIVGADGSADTNLLYTGQEFDSESELVYMNARYYNPVLGRFISRDGVLGQYGDLIGRNGYVYVKNNPLKYTDPSGMEESSPVGVLELLDDFSQGFLDSMTESMSFGLIQYEPRTSGPAYQFGRNYASAGQFTRGVVEILAGIASIFGGGATQVATVPQFVACPGTGGITCGTALLTQGISITITTAGVIVTVDGAATIASTWKSLTGGGGGGGPLKPLTASNFKENLVRQTGEKPLGAQAHHTIPQKLRDKIFNKFGDALQIDHPKYGSWVEASEHSHSWSLYNKTFKELMDSRGYNTIQDIEDIARETMKKVHPTAKINF